MKDQNYTSLRTALRYQLLAVVATFVGIATVVAVLLGFGVDLLLKPGGAHIRLTPDSAVPHSAPVDDGQTLPESSFRRDE